MDLIPTDEQGDDEIVSMIPGIPVDAADGAATDGDQDMPRPVAENGPGSLASILPPPIAEDSTETGDSATDGDAAPGLGALPGAEAASEALSSLPFGITGVGGGDSTADLFDFLGGFTGSAVGGAPSSSTPSFPFPAGGLPEGVGFPAMTGDAAPAGSFADLLGGGFGAPGASGGAFPDFSDFMVTDTASGFPGMFPGMGGDTDMASFFPAAGGSDGGFPAFPGTGSLPGMTGTAPGGPGGFPFGLPSSEMAGLFPGIPAAASGGRRAGPFPGAFGTTGLFP